MEYSLTNDDVKLLRGMSFLVWLDITVIHFNIQLFSSLIFTRWEQIAKTRFFWNMLL